MTRVTVLRPAPDEVGATCVEAVKTGTGVAAYGAPELGGARELRVPHAVRGPCVCRAIGPARPAQSARECHPRGCRCPIETQNRREENQPVPMLTESNPIGPPTIHGVDTAGLPTLGRPTPDTDT